MKPIRVLLAGDESMHAALEARIPGGTPVRVVAVAADAWEAIRIAGLERPDVAVLGSCFPGAQDAARSIRKVSPGTRVLVGVPRGREASLVPMLRAGASGYILDGRSAEDQVMLLKAAVTDPYDEWEAALFASPASSAPDGPHARPCRGIRARCEAAPVG